MNNLCETHFPELILYHFDRPICKKCIPEVLKQQQSQKKSGNKSFNEGQLRDIFSMLGMSNMALNAYQAEKNSISRSLSKIDDIKKGVKFQR